MSTRIGGDVRRVVVAAPQYLDSRAAIGEPSDLSRHDLIAFSNFGLRSWASHRPAGRPSQEPFTSPAIVNSVRAGGASAAEGMGVTRLYSYHVAECVRDGRLRSRSSSGGATCAACPHPHPSRSRSRSESARLHRLCSPASTFGTWTHRRRIRQPRIIAVETRLAVCR